MYSPNNEANLNSLEKIRQPSNSTPLHGNQTLETEDPHVTCDWHLAKCWVPMIQIKEYQVRYNKLLDGDLTTFHMSLFFWSPQSIGPEKEQKIRMNKHIHIYRGYRWKCWYQAYHQKTT